MLTDAIAGAVTRKCELALCAAGTRCKMVAADVGAVKSILIDTVAGVVSRKCALALCVAGTFCTIVAADATPTKFTRVDRWQMRPVHERTVGLSAKTLLNRVGSAAS